MMKQLLFLITLVINFHVYPGGIVEKLTSTGEKQQLFIGVVEEKRKQLSDAQETLADLRSKDQKFAQQMKNRIEEISNFIIVTERELQADPDNTYLNKKITILKENYQVLKETQRVRDDLLSLVEDFIKELEKYLKDPDFSSFKKEYKLQEHLYYSFENLQQLHDHIIDQERRVKQLSDQEKNTQTERGALKKLFKSNKEAYEKKQEEIKEFEEAGIEDFGFGLDPVLEKELLHLDEQVFRNKRKLYDLRIKLIEYKLSFIQLQLFQAKSHLDLLRQHLKMIKPAIRVSEADVVLAKEELAKKRKEYYSSKEKLQQEREKISSIVKRLDKELELLSKQLNISLGREIDDWGKEPKKTINSYLSIAQVGTINSQIKTLQRNLDLIDAQMAFEDEKFNYNSLQVEAKETYYKIIGRKFVTEEDITKERKKFDGKKDAAQASLKLYQEKINNVANLLNNHKKIIDNIKALYENAQENKAIFKGALREYNNFVSLLNRAEEQVRKQIDILGKLTGVYSGIVAEINHTIRLVDFTIGELQASTIWYRPEYAITWQGLKNIIPDAMNFFNDVRSYIVQVSPFVLVARIQDTFSQPLEWLLFVLKLILLVVVLLLIKRNEPIISQNLLERGQSAGGLLRIILFFITTVLRYIATHVVGISLWVASFLLFQLMRDPYLDIFFYLLSIPYLIYLTRQFIKTLIRLNDEQGYVLLPEDFQRRFELVFSALAYITIIRFFFVQAFRLFMLTTYYRSELPTILLAVNFIILQISLILLITKEQILSIIPEKTDLWRWIREQVDHYYYLILLAVITIIIMGNPYVGFGRLVLYLLSGMVYTALLAKGLLWLHGLVKQGISFIFFTSEEPVVRERFSYAKTWFGLSIIASFIVLSFIGFIIIARIWGWPIGFDDMLGLIKEPIMLKGTKSPVSTLSVLQIILFVLSGFLAAYALNQFVLAKIFDLLLVDSGVQHTVTRIIQYLVITIAVFIGFNNVGLGSFVGYMFTALALSVGWYIKDPISDFFAYFIILVQRPIKIGDYVQIDQETSGVIRKITARAIVLRKKNSTTIVVPNTYVVSRAIENWNYVRNFIAVNDILIHVSYKEDPNQVKQLLFEAVDAHQNVLKNPKVIIRLEEFGEFGFTFLIRAFISSAYTLEMWDIASELRLAMVQKLREHNIEIAVPIRRIVEIGPEQKTMKPKQKVVDPAAKNSKE